MDTFYDYQLVNIICLQLSMDNWAVLGITHISRHGKFIVSNKNY